MGRIGMSELLVIFLLVLMIFGAKRLPEIGQALGRAIREFKKAGKEVEDEVNSAAQDRKSEKGE